MKKIEHEIEQYFENKETPELSIQTQDKLRNLVKTNKRNNKTTILKRVAIFASSVCLILLMIVPTIVILNKNETPNKPTSPVYYGKDEAIKKDLTIEETKEIIYNSYEKYNFIFDEFSFSHMTGFYNPKNNSILAIQIKANEIAVPYTQVELHLIVSDQFILENQEFYTSNSIYSKTDTFELYKKQISDTFNEQLRAYVRFHDHELYILLNVINETLLNKFL